MPIYKRPEDPEDDDLLEEGNTPEPEVRTEEDKTWKKRYGDLRKFASNLQARLKSLEDNQNNVMLPASDDEDAINEWVQRYPQVARIVQGIANREAARANESLSVRLQEINEREQQSRQEIAQAKLAEAHPDFFDTIRHQPEFHEWLASKSQTTQDAIYGDSYDWKAAADVVDMYKVFTEKNKKKPKAPKNEDAAREIPRRNSPTPSADRGGYVFTESQINQMRPDEYDALEEEIEKAWRENKVLRDMTGGARG